MHPCLERIVLELLHPNIVICTDVYMYVCIYKIYYCLYVCKCFKDITKQEKKC